MPWTWTMPLPRPWAEATYGDAAHFRGFQVFGGDFSLEADAGDEEVVDLAEEEKVVASALGARSPRRLFLGRPMTARQPTPTNHPNQQPHVPAAAASSSSTALSPTAPRLPPTSSTHHCCRRQRLCSAPAAAPAGVLHPIWSRLAVTTARVVLLPPFLPLSVLATDGLIVGYD